MTSSNTQTGRTVSTKIADRVALKVSDALKSEGLAGLTVPALPALIAGEVAEVLAGLSAERRQELNSHSAELKQRVRGVFEGFGRQSSDKIRLDMPAEIEPSNGEGLGAIVSSEQGERDLDTITVSRKLEDWAGTVAGATELNRQYGVARSSLNRWQHVNDVIGLLKGTRKHVYPVEQFVDGRPARGLRDVIRLAGSHRVAWLWLIQHNPALGDRSPIDLLKKDRVKEVVDAARSYFLPQ
ncbi:Protein of unknown function (DUF2384) [Hoeflea sp. IMCC20628]|uniref:antitoxin Xre/MbcA/ParS-like domain-containing protein n=1 Tax=Hoeflea sp. IMCC20628 TaxID=1620421 RepID=UPI00063ABC78|nr:antitoxin Xre/MbcA/ParS toxin-binding domain-containing protein [Hoeflea sp. IMCC20628]AKI02100.1 Protein of unknown function (DUF2384) [Hoeflea sp. IMCC20628]